MARLKDLKPQRAAPTTSKPILLRFKFDDFENLPSEPGAKTKTEKVSDDDGRRWRLTHYPGDGSFGIFLGLCQGPAVNAKVAFIVRDASGRVYCFMESGDIDCHDVSKKMAYGFSDSEPNPSDIARANILDKDNNVLASGALMVDVLIQKVAEKADYQPPAQNSLVEKLLDHLKSEKDTDVSFKVGGELIQAHRLILSVNAPLLHSFIAEQEDGTPVPIEGTSPEVFRLLLRYIYGGDASEAIRRINVGWKSIVNGKLGIDIIEAADRYGVVSLKLAVETALVERCILDLDNVVDWILFADAKTCPLLKEHATNYCSVMMKDVLDHESSTKLKESPKLLSELMVAFSSTKPDGRFGETSMTVSELRAKLEEEGLDLDGSREMLVSRLNAANKRQRTE